MASVTDVISVCNWFCMFSTVDLRCVCNYPWKFSILDCICSGTLIWRDSVIFKLLCSYWLLVTLVLWMLTCGNSSSDSSLLLTLSLFISNTTWIPRATIHAIVRNIIDISVGQRFILLFILNCFYCFWDLLVLPFVLKVEVCCSESSACCSSCPNVENSWLLLAKYHYYYYK